MENKGYKLQIEIENACAEHIDEFLYLHGDFNQWDSMGHLLGRIPPPGSSAMFNLDGLDRGLQDFKLSRGSMQTLLADISGHQAGPVQAKVGVDAGIRFLIQGWRDDFPLSTASPQVTSLEAPFYFKRLDTYKTIWVYLPDNYKNSTTHYPVLYMHDGQDLFDEARAGGKAGSVEWSVDEVIDKGADSCIVVGIDRAGDAKQRASEYLTHPYGAIEEARGLDYLHDIVHTLKPFIDAQYRTRPEAEYTAMAGSSLGGLLSLYAGLLYPETFSRLGIFSPSLWMDSGNALKLARSSAAKLQGFYLYAGAEEQRLGSTRPVDMLGNLLKLQAALAHNPNLQVQIHVETKGRHGAWYWKQVFPQFYHWWITSLKIS